MAYQIVGESVLGSGKRVIDRGSSHADAVRAARDRAKPSSSVGLAPTAHVTVSLDFADAAPYATVVDVDEAMAADIAATSSTEEVRRLMRRKPAEVVEAHAVTVKAKSAAEPFRHGGREFAAGDYVVLWPDRRVEGVTRADFDRRFTTTTSPAPKSETPPTPTAPKSKPTEK